MANNLWDKQADETPYAYSMFMGFLQQGVGRRVREYARSLGKKDPAMLRLAQRYNWYKRAAAYDQEVVSTQITVQATNDLKPHQDLVVMKMLDDYKKLLDLWNQAYQETLEAGNIAPYTLSSLVSARRQIDDMGRRAVRLPNNIKDMVLTEESNPLSGESVPELLFPDVKQPT